MSNYKLHDLLSNTPKIKRLDFRDFESGSMIWYIDKISYKET